MTPRHEPTRNGTAAIVFAIAGTAIYLLMINVTLAQIEALSGQRAFDMRPAGYGLQEARQILTALGVEGRLYYLTRQIPLDTLYPALLALTLVSTLRWFGMRLRFKRPVCVGIAFSIGAAVFDYAENLGIAAMILSWPNISAGLVFATSCATVVKSGLTVAAVAMTLVFGGLWLVRRPAGPR